MSPSAVLLSCSLLMVNLSVVDRPISEIISSTLPLMSLISIMRSIGLIAKSTFSWFHLAISPSLILMTLSAIPSKCLMSMPIFSSFRFSIVMTKVDVRGRAGRVGLLAVAFFGRSYVGLCVDEAVASTGSGSLFRSCRYCGNV